MILCCATAAISLGADSLASIELRLTTPLTSYGSKPGTAFESIVMSTRGDQRQQFLPPGTIVRGEVRKRAAVGMGIRHERASLDLAFVEYQLPDGQVFPFEAKLRTLENARESVTDKGTIRGVLAARTPHTFLQGVWRTPNLELFQRSFMGLTGASGKIFSQFSTAGPLMGPISAAAIFGIRVAIFRMAEPEIQLPAGTEMRISLMNVPSDAPTFDAPDDLELDPDLIEALNAQPAAIRKADGHIERDIINVAFQGTREQVINAFRTAGWSQADRWSLKVVQRGFMAYNRQTGFNTAPTSKLYYRNTEPDLVFQKSLDTMSKRHHVRIWRAEIGGQEVWLGAATHDIGLTFHDGMFTHQIHPKIDYERGKIVADLAFEGCSEGTGYVDRPLLQRNWLDGDGIITDGRLAVVSLLNDCSPRDGIDLRAGLVMQKPPRSGASGLARRLVLEGRNYVLRSNPYYMVYDAWRWHRNQRVRNAALLEE